ncbi:YciI family protein [Paenibacillus sp. MWE-103]|uniref:YciI family protein n=1 Tax=Paenibacillus artemisiicola TaxID=1172618 RepID=A0ABS3WJ49_9BACL|nr:YciI family protein [Paenibacillus artemisiicola]MBO7748359.1 YciI family protein [Paenibacillus artemisiicola]
MRYMLLVKATARFEAGIAGGAPHALAWTAFREALADAGALLAEEWLRPSASGVRIAYPAPGCRPELTAGPFVPETGTVAGYVLIEAGSAEEATAWALRMPEPDGGGEVAIEVRELAEREGPLNWRTEASAAELRDHLGMLRRL